MSKAKVLYIHVTGVSAEILKNLVLAGIRAVLCDNRPYPQAVLDTPSFLLSAQDRTEPISKKPKYETVAQAMKSVVEELNPLLGDCEIAPEYVADLSESYLEQFSIVVASRVNMSDAIRISKATTAAGGKFYMADTFGMYGAGALDLGNNHVYRPELGKKLLDPTPLKTHVPLDQVLLLPLKDAINRFHKTPPPSWIRYRAILEYVERKKEWPTEEKADDFAQTVRQWIQESSPNLIDHELLTETALNSLAKVATSEVAPTCAVLGGIIGNEVIKAISGKGEPANNTLLFEGLSCKAWTFLVQPKK